MSQIFAPKRSSVSLFQDLYFSRRRTMLQSSVKEVACIACGKTLDDGVSVTATLQGRKMHFFCQAHLPRD